MRSYTLYIGLRPASDPDADTDLIASATADRFESFTIFEATGWFRRRREPVRVVKIATDDHEGVLSPPRGLRARLRQDGVGLECDGRYRRVTEADDRSAAT